MMVSELAWPRMTRPFFGRRRPKPSTSPTNDEGKRHMWNTTCHAFRLPAYTYEAIANAVMPENMSPEEFLKDSDFRSPEAMYWEFDA